MLELKSSSILRYTTIGCGSIHRWATKALNSLSRSIIQNLQVQCAAKPDHLIGPTLGQADPTTWYSQQLKAMLKGKGCLKVIRPEKTDISPVLALWSEGATNWK